MQGNLVVTDVVNLYYAETQFWRRNRKRMRMHNAVVLFVEGGIEYYFENETIEAHAGDLLLLSGNLPYSGRCLTQKVAYFVLDFDCLGAEDFEAFGAPAAVRIEALEEMRRLFSEALSHWQEHKIDCETRTKGFLYEILSEFLRIDAARSRPTRAHDDIIAYIRHHFCEVELTVSSLCERFFISESQIRRNVMRATGYSPSEYITELRINRAKNELLQSGKAIKEIATACGFSSPYYFSRCFSKHTGMSPKEFRERFSLA